MSQCCTGNCNQGRLCPNKYIPSYFAVFITGVVTGATLLAALSYILNNSFN